MFYPKFLNTPSFGKLLNGVSEHLHEIRIVYCGVVKFLFQFDDDSVSLKLTKMSKI